MQDVDIVVQGYPGKAVCHGGLGWSTIALIRAGSRAALVDVGGFGIRKPLIQRLAARKLAPAEAVRQIRDSVAFASEEGKPSSAIAPAGLKIVE